MNNSELILNHDGSLYHIGIRPEHCAPLIITVGDPDRVPIVSQFFDRIDFTNRKKGSTNSVSFFLAAAGIPFFIIVFYMLYSQQFILEKRLWFFIFIVISLMSEPLLLRPFFLTFVMSGTIYFFEKLRWKEY